MVVDRYKSYDGRYCVLMSDKEIVYTIGFSKKSQSHADKNAKGKYYRKYGMLPAITKEEK